MKAKTKVEVEPAGLSEADKEFLRADKERRQRHAGGENEIEAIQKSPEVIAQLQRADAIEREHQRLAVGGRELDEQLENYLPLSRSAGSIVESILTERTELRRLLGMTNHAQIFSYVERLSRERVTNFTVPSVASVLERQVNEFAEAVNGIPRKIQTLNEMLAFYARRLRNLNPGQSIGAPEAREGVPREVEGDGIRVISNFRAGELE